MSIIRLTLAKSSLISKLKESRCVSGLRLSLFNARRRVGESGQTTMEEGLRRAGRGHRGGASPPTGAGRCPQWASLKIVQ